MNAIHILFSVIRKNIFFCTESPSPSLSVKHISTIYLLASLDFLKINQVGISPHNTWKSLYRHCTDIYHAKTQGVFRTDGTVVSCLFHDGGTSIALPLC